MKPYFGTKLRLKKWQDDLSNKLKKLEGKQFDDFNSSIAQRKHRYAKMDKLEQEIVDLETAINALEFLQDDNPLKH